MSLRRTNTSAHGLGHSLRRGAGTPFAGSVLSPHLSNLSIASLELRWAPQSHIPPRDSLREATTFDAARLPTLFYWQDEQLCHVYVSRGLRCEDDRIADVFTLKECHLAG